jgi:outer membrane protein assembly factor BamB
VTRAALPFSALLVAAMLLAAASPPEANWPRFRGPGAAGLDDRAVIPLSFSPENSCLWKRTVPPGKSSPILAGNRLFLTAHEGDILLTLALDRGTGRTLWTRSLRRTHIDRRNETNDPAVPTPVTDGRAVYVFFADFGLAAYTVDGRERWRCPLGPFTSPHGIATSPLLIDGVLVLMLEQLENGAIIGVDAASGKVIWSVPRPPSLGGSFSTPVEYQPAPAAEKQAVVVSPFELAAYAPRTGDKLWRVGGLPHQPKSSPFVAGDLIVAGVEGDNARGRLKSWEQMLAELDKDANGKVEGGEITGSIADYDHDGDFDRTDYDRWFIEKSPESRLMAVRPQGRGDLTARAVVWSTDRGVPRVTTPVLYGDLVYLMRNGGILTVLDASTGAVVKEGRLPGAIDEYFASPVAAAGRLLAMSRGCALTTIRAGRDWEPLASSDLGEECFATPALGRDGIFIRTTTALYRFSAGLRSSPTPAAGTASNRSTRSPRVSRRHAPPAPASPPTRSAP